jgi:hypothetical protein
MPDEATTSGAVVPATPGPQTPVDVMRDALAGELETQLGEIEAIDVAAVARVALNTGGLLADDMLQMMDRGARMEAALRLIRINVMGEFMSQESGALRDWLRDWIDGFDNGAVQHGPVGGPMLWPAAMPNVCRQLTVWGFQPVVGPHGIKYVALKRLPDAGEVMQ